LYFFKINIFIDEIDEDILIKNFKYMWFGGLSAILVLLLNIFCPILFQPFFLYYSHVIYIAEDLNFSITNTHTSVYSELYRAFFQVGLTEELCKGFIIYLSIRKVKNDLLICLIRAMIISFGFALFENVNYALYYESFQVLYTRSVVPVLAHISMSMFIIIGMVSEKYNYKIKGVSTYSIINGFICATFWHGLYDYVIMYNPELTHFFKLDYIILVACVMHVTFLTRELLNREKLTANEYQHIFN
jgi:RsiW-degrading membrane proteinase PrsW (M82 family)